MKYILILVLFIFSCNDDVPYSVPNMIEGQRYEVVISGFNEDMTLFTVDSCQYLVMNSGQGRSPIHHGNCKNTKCIYRQIK